MSKSIALSALPLAVMALLPVPSAASAQPADRPLLLAQEGPPPQQEAAPGDDDKERKATRRDHREGAPPAVGAQAPPPKEMEGPPNEHRKSAAPAEGPPPEALGEKRRPSWNDGPARQPRAKVQAPSELPAEAQTPGGPPAEAPAKAAVEVQAPDVAPTLPPQEPRQRKRAQPDAGKPPEKMMQAAPELVPPPEALRAPAEADAPPPEEQPRPQATKPQGPKPEESLAPQPDRAARLGAPGGNMENIKKQRRQRTEEGGKRTVIEEPGNRVIVKEGGEARIHHDETERLRRTSRDVRREKGKDGTSVTIALRPGGVEIFSEFDTDGRLLRRYRRSRDGRETNLIDNRRYRGDHDHYDRSGFGFYVDLRPPRIRIPRDRYIVEYEYASEDDIYDALMAPPVEELDRGYSLDEIRYNRNLRDRMRRVDLDTVNFAFGSWEVGASQYDKLARVAHAINRILDRRPDEIFLVEGHTDAVGSDIDNLTLSDRRAEEVAYILTESFNVPPENLVTQGYGEQYLKIDTPEPERANRRVAVRRITPLMSRR